MDRPHFLTDGGHAQKVSLSLRLASRARAIMAALQSPDLVSITINEVPLEVPKGELIVESVKRLGLEIPIFCYHPRMEAVGMCRMCLVEVGFRQPDGTVKRMPKPQTGCTLPASDGMAIYTDTESVHRDRRGVLEFLLANHPLDCPICDRGGECPLQNNTLFYGPSTSRFIEAKRHLPKAFPLSRYVTLDLERCIQCGRCVRFTEEISGDSQLAFRFRGAQMQPTTFELTDFTSKFSGNTIEICPVGALTSRQYRFRARPWDLETKPAICTVCSNGCNIWFDFRTNRFVRVNGRTNEAVNEEWTCDRGKFGHDFYNSPGRLTTPLLRDGERLRACSWPQAYEAIGKAFGAGGNSVGGLCKPTFSNEGLFLFQRLFRRTFASNNIDHRWTRQLRSGSRPQTPTPIAALEDKAAIFVIGTSLADELPIVFLRVRKAASRYGAKVVSITDRSTEVDEFADQIIRYESGRLKEALDALASRRAGPAGPADKHAQAAVLLGPGAVIITSESLWNDPQANAAYETLAKLATDTGAEFNCYGLYATSHAALGLGVLPDAGPGARPIEGAAGLGTHGILQAGVQGSLDALWLVECDPMADYHDAQLAEQALERTGFLVYQAVEEGPSMAYASVVLPMEAPAEYEGSYTNCEGRVQRVMPCIKGPGDAKPAWRIFMEAMLRAAPDRPMFNAGEVMAQIANEAPPYRSALYEHLGPEGVLLAEPQAAPV